MATYVSLKETIASAYNDLADLINEDTLYIDQLTILRKEGEYFINLCRSSIILNNAFLTKTMIAQVNWKHFYPLFNFATRLKPNSSTGYVTGLRIHWGISVDGGVQSLCPVFQPVCLNLNEKGLTYNSSLHTTNKYDIVETQKAYYTYDGTSFNTCTENEFTTYTTNYRNLILFSRDGGATKLPFNDAMDIKGDVRSELYTFQEIFAEMYVNQLDYVYLYNAIKTVPSQDLFKHTIFLSPNIVTEAIPMLAIRHISIEGSVSAMFEALSFRTHFPQNCFADLAHLCPPNCDMKLPFEME